MRTVRTVAFTAAVVALALSFAAAPVAAGDRTVALALIDQGKKALAKKSWTDAATLFRKAMQEAPELVEAEFLRAQALEKGGSRQEAVAAYRSFLELLEHKSDATKDELALKPQAEKRITALAAGELEIQKLDDPFCAQLLAFAKKYKDKDKAMAVEALRLLLLTKPDHAEAAEMYSALGGPALDGGDKPADSKPAADSPFGKLKIATWHDLIADQSLNASSIQYADPGIVVDMKGGSLVKVGNSPDLGTKYVIDVEYRVVQEYERGWFAGALFGLAGDDMYTAFAQKSQAVVNHGNWKTGPGSDVISEAMKPVELGTWHRLGVKVDGLSIELWLDGKKVGSAGASGRTDLSGTIGLAQQRCKAEYRTFRAASYE